MIASAWRDTVVEKSIIILEQEEIAIVYVI